MRTVVFIVGFFIALLGYIAGATFGTVDAAPALSRRELGPATTVVKLANGQEVTCVTVGQAITCDWSAFVSGPTYGKPKP